MNEILGLESKLVLFIDNLPSGISHSAFLYSHTCFNLSLGAGNSSLQESPGRQEGPQVKVNLGCTVRVVFFFLKRLMKIIITLMFPNLIDEDSCIFVNFLG